VGGVECVVGLLQQVGDHQRRVRHGHRHDAQRKPARGRDARDQRAERHTAERRQRYGRALPRQTAAIGPREREYGQDEQRERGCGTAHQPAERQRCQQRHGDQRDIGERSRAPTFVRLLNRDEADHRHGRDERPPHARQPAQAPQREGAREQYDRPLT